MTDNKYINGKIYKITDNAYSECYIGSTLEILSRRMAGHRKGYSGFIQGKSVSHNTVYNLFNKYGLENCKIELIELVPCNTLMELRQKEGYYIKNSECVNKSIPGRTRHEYEIDNKDRLKEKRQIYNDINSDIISEKMKLYRLKNLDRTKQYNKEYNEQHRTKKIKIPVSKFCVCDSCNCEMLKCHKNRHERSIKHLNNFKNIDVITETPETSKQD
jgi:hypothetical protein